MRIRISKGVPGVDADAAARWWADFRDGHEDHPRIPGHRRRIVARDAGSITMEEETRLAGVRLFFERVTAWPEGREVRFGGRNNFAIFDGAYRFEPDGDGTRIVLEANVQLRRPIEWTDVAAKPLVAGILRADLAAHATDMRRDLKGR